MAISQDPPPHQTAAAVAAAVAKHGLEIPLIDFAPFSQPSASNKPARGVAAAEVLKGFQQSGFIYLKNHGISPQAVSRTLALSSRFFARPAEQKLSLAFDVKANRGYSAPGREKVTKPGSDTATMRELEGADLKESFEIGREGEEGFPNHWPDAIDADGQEFKVHMVDFWTQCKNLSLMVMEAIAVGMGLGDDWFAPYMATGDNTLRLLHYPPVSPEVFRKKPGTMRAGAHSDYGSITLLFQDSRGGLQVQSPDGQFVDATPIPDTVVVNAGDMLARWANDTIRSTTHRVVEPPIAPEAEEGSHPARYSIAYFVNPNFDILIEALPGTYNEQTPKKYPGVLSGDYLFGRLAETY